MESGSLVATSADAVSRTEIDTGMPADDDAHGQPGPGRAVPRWVVGITASAVLLSALVLIWPVLAAPVHADQRYMYFQVPGRVQGDWLDIIRILWSEIPGRAETGRMTPIGYFMQWLSYNGVTELSVATGTPLITLHSILKVILLAMGVLCVAAFVKSLRGRRPDGELLAPSRSTVWLVVAGVVVLGAVGVQTHLQFRNGWISYPILTYGAVVVGFGSVALVLWLARLMAERYSRARVGLGLAAMVLLGIFLNLSYELYYAAFPAAVLALLIQPDPTDDRRRRYRLAKLTTGGTLTVTFLGAFVAIRLWLADACLDQCYIGTEVQLSGEALRYSWYNLASSLPLSGRTEALEVMSRLGLDSLPGPFSSPLTVASVLAGAALVAARIVLRRDSGRDDIVAEAAAGRPVRAESAAESGALVRGAVVSVVLALGSVAVMSVSAQVPDIIVGPGYPYRHIVVTWVALCTAGLLCLIAVDLRVRRTIGVGLWVATGVVATLVAAVMLPINMQATRAELLSPSIQVTEPIHREIILGDLSASGDPRRCATIAALSENGVPPVTVNFVTDAAQSAFRHFHGVDYCSQIDD